MQKKIYLIVIILLTFLNSCNNKNVQLPKIELEGIPQIHNHSSIWVFYEIKNQDTIAVLNKNNKIINTHLIFNIDKRLTMGKISPILTKIQFQVNKPSMHKKEGFFNYFSYADVLSNHISVLIFNPTTFIYTKKEYQDFLTQFSKNNIIELEIQNNYLILDNEKIDTDQLAQKINTLQLNDTLKKFNLLLKYHKNTTYQNYLKTKAFLNKIEVQTDSIEYIYSWQ